MEHILSRAAATCNPAGGLMLAEHFQMAYVTTDLERALDLFKRRLGVQTFSRLEGQMPAGGHIRAEFAWVGTIMYEVICASGPGSDIYMDRLPRSDEFHIRHHHLGFLLRTREQWDDVMVKAQESGWSVPYHNNNPLVEVCFVDATELGHYLEYFLPKQAGLSFFGSVPRH
jgi:Glyoxalase/Bleomycin resistance protein/Dioxygenase superfamily